MVNVAVPSDVLPFKNWTEPVAVDGETVAVSVTAWPNVEGEGPVEKVVLVGALFTVCGTAIEVLAANVEQTRPFWTEQPFVPVGGEEIDRRATHIEGKRPQPLNRIEKEQRPSAMGDLGDCGDVVSPAAGVADPTDRNNSGPLIAGVGEAIQIDPGIAQVLLQAVLRYDRLLSERQA